MLEFVSSRLWGSLTIVSARELHLILAEAFLAQNDLTNFALEINAVRGLDGLTAYDPNDPTHPAALTMLQFERQVNLFLGGRRLNDHYRFGVRADLWRDDGDAVRNWGVLFPITNVELESNPCVRDPSRPECQPSG